MRNHMTLWNESSLSPWRGLMDLQRNLDRVFDQTFGDRSDRWADEAVFHPVCEVDETDSHFVMSVDLPGVNKKDINIEARDNQLIISGERKSEKKERGFSERLYGKFYRVITLPNGVDTNKIEAHYQDGVLNVALPKAESAKPKQIKISDGKGSFFGRLVEGKPSSANNAA
jgi:HSP20 family protein